MDYNSIHGPGISNFSSSSPHRMPTVSAAQALQDLKSSHTRCISTGLDLLDAFLQNRESVSSDVEPLYGGVSRRKVTEVYGPPGIGKTALGMQLAASALHAGEGVIWVDASHPVSGSRLSQILTSFKPSLPQSSTQEARTLPDLLETFTHFSTPTLAHLIALLSHPTQHFPPQNISLIIIDSFSTLISSAFPRTADATGTPRKPGAPNPSARKFPILQYLITTLQKLAATRNIAIVVFSQCVTKMRPGTGAVLVPAINTMAWEQGLGCRVALFRDWDWDDEEGRLVDDVRLAQIIKAEGIAVPEGRARLAGFSIADDGLTLLTFPTLPTLTSPHAPAPLIPSTTTTPTLPLPLKRKLSATDLEIPDSEGEGDEDYGWAEEDEEDVPPPPPQWQGSEDHLAPGEGGELEAEEIDVELNFEDELVEGGGNGEQKERSGIGRTEIEDSEDELAL
ncbi:P-loop containing nucleoside triphosphate hydrolase protein [Hyaloscypha bicolor E]|uniref:DNA repair protein RAD51 homolog 3 n=1 Tax=Hyaloscypha bicolor E TaxID=1095630 RepID=A0A2J6SHD2_9HELO|nr:P-loop containing nucleoside triphosphate hydrolase protein [Hyaloscypha bicolor E]PMD50186.1 P-loop containing nucleoside triphosphate hydrolase protein [Hyaloscypha bicolor E]